MNRRHFLVGTLATPFALRAASPKFDLVIKGGRVIDPSRKFDGLADVGITQGRITAVRSGIATTGAEVFDAKGKLVVPGLIDIHTHATRIADGPSLCLADGVTGIIDAGSQGATRINEPISVAAKAPQICRVLVNIGRDGIITEGDTMDLARADVAAAKGAIERNRAMVVGVKARLSREVAGANDFEVMKRAQEVATAFRVPLMIHMGQTVSELSKLFPLLKRGDIVTHMFAPPPNSIIDNNGRILPEVVAARKRGVFFDLGNGRTGHLRWDMGDSIMKAGFLPDTFSTDWTPEGRTVQIFDFPNVISKFLLLGMRLDQIIACATVNAAKTFPAFHDRGTLRVGAPADVAILDLREGNFEFVDNFEGKRKGSQRLFPVATVLAGKVVARR